METVKDLAVELRRTHPDYVVYAPAREGRDTHDTGNEHFLVFESPRGDLLALWTQSSYEGAGDHRIVIARSRDGGASWTPPRRIVGPAGPGDGYMASWGFPIVSASGRIYAFWNQYHGIDDVIHQFTGTFDVCCSDDDGETWSEPVTLPMPRTDRDHPDPGVPANWIVWQKPARDSQGRWLTGFTRWTSRAVRPEPPDGGWWGSFDSACEFVRFDNLDDGPDPADIRLTFLQTESVPPEQGGPLRVPYRGHPEVSCAQEPSWVTLPDGRLFVTMRTFAGAIWYSVSDDDGATWRAPEPLLRHDGGEPLLQPLCCCPIYATGDGRFLLVYHNNDGHAHGHEPKETMFNRRPAYWCAGEFRPDAHQPIAFSDTRFLMDNDGVPLGPLNRLDLAVYTSYTEHRGERVLWYPDRKFFLCGRIITDAMLAMEREGAR